MTYDTEARLRHELETATGRLPVSGGDWRDVRRRARRRLTERLTVAGGGLAVLAVIAGSVLVATSDRTPAPPATPQSPVVARVDVGTADVASLVAADGVAWASRWELGDVVAVTGGAISRTIPLGDARTGALSLAVTDGTLWATRVADLSLARFRTSDGSALDPIRSVDVNANGALAAADGGVWLACCANEGRGVLRFYADDDGRVVTDATTRGDGGADVAVAAGHVWVSRPGSVDQFTRTGERVRRHQIPGGGGAFVVGDDEVVWFLTDNLLTRVDPATGATLATVPFPQLGDIGSQLPAAGGVAVAAFGDLWVSAGDTLHELDSETGAVLASLDVPRSGRLAADSSSLWVVSGTEIWTVDPAAVGS